MAVVVESDVQKTHVNLLSRLARYAICGPCVLFLLLALPNLDKPGLQYDETLEAGLPAVHLLNNQPVVPLNGAAIHLFGYTLPLMVQDHIGAAQVYLALPFIALLGPTAVALRLMTVFTGLFSLIGLYLFLLNLYGKRAALYGSLWLAGCASFVFWMRQGVFVTSLALCFSMAMLAVGAYWWRSHKLWALGVAGFCGGFSIYCKLNATWIVFGLVAWFGLALVLAYVRQSRAQKSLLAPVVFWRNYLPFATWRTLVMAFGGLLFGLLPLILYNIVTHGATWRVIRASATTTTYEGATNSAVLANVQTRFQQIADVILSGSHLWYLGGSAPNILALLSVVAALFVLTGLCIQRRGRGWQTLLLAPFLLLASVLQSCFTISALWPTHFAVSIALPAIIFGVAAAQLEPYVQRWRLGVLLLIVVVAFVIVSQLISSVVYARAVATTGGQSQHTAAIYDLSSYVSQQHAHIVVLDWGISAQLEYLNNSRLSMEQDANTDPASSTFRNNLQKRLNPKSLYITHATNQEVFPARAIFLTAVAADHMYAQRVKTFTSGDGSPVFEVWQVQGP